MIDDDFESVFRKMIENFMGSMGFPDGEVEVRTWSSTFPRTGTDMDVTPQQVDPEIEEIDLGDDYMILVETKGQATPSVSIEGREARIDFESDIGPIRIPLSFDVDIPSSTASYQNGILEIVLRKAAEDYSGESEGVVQVE